MRKRWWIIVVILVVIGVLGSASVALARGGVRALRQRGMMGAVGTMFNRDGARAGLCAGEGVACDGECGLQDCPGAGGNTAAGVCDQEDCTANQDGTCAREGSGAGRGRMGGCGR
jgi:hypothetical protein